jgi:hypothetical protein
MKLGIDRGLRQIPVRPGQRSPGTPYVILYGLRLSARSCLGAGQYREGQRS